MSSPQLEAFLVRLYTDAQLREQFLIAPRAVASAANLTPDEVDAMCQIDRIGLQLASASIASKRSAYRSIRKSLLRALLGYANRIARG